MPNKVIVTSLPHLDMFWALCQNRGKRWIPGMETLFWWTAFNSFWHRRYISRLFPKSPGFFTLISRFSSFGVERSVLVMILSIFETFAFSHVTKRKNTLWLFSDETLGFRYGAKSHCCRFWFRFFRSRHVMIRACGITQRNIVFSKKAPEEEVWLSHLYLDALGTCYFDSFDLWCLYLLLVNLKAVRLLRVFMLCIHRCFDWIIFLSVPYL